MQLLPAVLMRDPACRIDAASSTESIPWRAGSILYKTVVYSNGIPQSCMEEFIPIQPVLEVLSVLSATAVIAAVALSSDPPQSSIRAVGLGDRSGSYGRIGSLV